MVNYSIYFLFCHMDTFKMFAVPFHNFTDYRKNISNRCYIYTKNQCAKHFCGDDQISGFCSPKCMSRKVASIFMPVEHFPLMGTQVQMHKFGPHSVISSYGICMYLTENLNKQPLRI
jgi:hypothetical protein